MRSAHFQLENGLPLRCGPSHGVSRVFSSVLVLHQLPHRWRLQPRALSAHSCFKLFVPDRARCIFEVVSETPSPTRSPCWSLSPFWLQIAIGLKICVTSTAISLVRTTSCLLHSVRTRWSKSQSGWRTNWVKVHAAPATHSSTLTASSGNHCGCTFVLVLHFLLQFILVVRVLGAIHFIFTSEPALPQSRLGRIDAMLHSGWMRLALAEKAKNCRRRPCS